MERLWHFLTISSTSILSHVAPGKVWLGCFQEGVCCLPQDEQLSQQQRRKDESLCWDFLQNCGDEPVWILQGLGLAHRSSHWGETLQPASLEWSSHGSVQVNFSGVERCVQWHQIFDSVMNFWWEINQWKIREFLFFFVVLVFLCSSFIAIF